MTEKARPLGIVCLIIGLLVVLFPVLRFNSAESSTLRSGSGDGVLAFSVLLAVSYGLLCVIWGAHFMCSAPPFKDVVESLSKDRFLLFLICLTATLSLLLVCVPLADFQKEHVVVAQSCIAENQLMAWIWHFHAMLMLSMIAGFIVIKDAGHLHKARIGCVVAALVYMASVLNSMPADPVKRLESALWTPYSNWEYKK